MRPAADTMAPQAAGVVSRGRVERATTPTMWSIPALHAFCAIKPCTSLETKAHRGNLSTRRLSEASP